MTVKTASAILEKDGKVLLIKRTNTLIFGGFWFLSGGKELVDKLEEKGYDWLK